MVIDDLEEYKFLILFLTKNVSKNWKEIELKPMIMKKYIQKVGVFNYFNSKRFINIFKMFFIII